MARSLLDLPQLYEQLEMLLRRFGVPVRCEPFDPRLFGDLTVQGGMCRLHGANVVLIDARAPLPDRVAVLAGVLAEFDLEGVYIQPQVRRSIECRSQHVRTPQIAPVIPIERARAVRSRATR